MKLRYKIILAVLSIFLLNKVAQHLILRATIIGTYISNNEHVLAEMPGFGDTLILKNNGTFTSTTWGNGTYKVRYKFTDADIYLTYNYEFGKAMVQSKVYRPWFGSPRIQIDPNFETYFAKTD